MRFLFVFLLTWIAAYFTLLFFPWWTPAFVAFILIMLFRTKKASTAFLAPALGNVCCCLMLVFFQDIPNHHLLSQKIATLFQLSSYMFLVAITALIAFVTAGLGGWVAACFRAAFEPSAAIRSGSSENNSASINIP